MLRESIFLNVAVADHLAFIRTRIETLKGFTVTGAFVSILDGIFVRRIPVVCAFLFVAIAAAQLYLQISVRTNVSMFWGYDCDMIRLPNELFVSYQSRASIACCLLRPNALNQRMTQNIEL